MNQITHKHLIRTIYSLLIIAALIVYSGSCNYKDKESVNPASLRLPKDILPVIGAWFWSDEDMNPEGYKKFIDVAAVHSPYNLLTTSIRIEGQEVIKKSVHDHVKMAVEYAKSKSIGIALDMDVRLARNEFQARYPDEQQELLRLHEVKLSSSDTATTVFHSIDLSDHMTGRTNHYVSLSASLIRAYSYKKNNNGIIENTISDITDKCIVKIANKDSVIINIPPVKDNNQTEACVMVSFTHFTPDVFSPHIIEFQREIIESYADVPLAGGMKDEWGFPPSREPLENQFWYSKHTAEAYSEKTGGNELLYDCLLMYAGIEGHEAARHYAVNNFMEMTYERNGEIEDDFYKTVKKVFGPDAAVTTHPTWHASPVKTEYKKNGLNWWIATRDWAQTDEGATFAARTSLAKKWNSPVCYNQFYAKERPPYQKELWSSVKAGGRINYHPLYPSDKERFERLANLLRGNHMAGECKVRLLNYISHSPVDCPVAIIFGHHCTMNWAGPHYNDVGLGIAHMLWAAGIPTDLIPSTEITNKSLHIDNEGYICYGPQKYSAVILYHPEFEKRSTADFFSQAANGKTKMFRIGDWTMDFSGEDFDGNAALPTSVKPLENQELVMGEIENILNNNNVEKQSTAILQGNRINHPSSGHCRLIDGTVIHIAGENNAAGDPIVKDIDIDGVKVSFDAIGIAAIRIGADGKPEALAAGGLQKIKTGDFEINMEQRADIAMWKEKNGKYKGVIQGWNGKIPAQLLDITKDWDKLGIPEPLPDLTEN